MGGAQCPQFYHVWQVLLLAAKERKGYAAMVTSESIVALHLTGATQSDIAILSSASIYQSPFIRRSALARGYVEESF